MSKKCALKKGEKKEMWVNISFPGNKPDPKGKLAFLKEGLHHVVVEPLEDSSRKQEWKFIHMVIIGPKENHLIYEFQIQNIWRREIIIDDKVVKVEMIHQRENPVETHYTNLIPDVECGNWFGRQKK